MRRRRAIRRSLRGLAAPPHRPGFWEDVEAELAAVDAAREAGEGEAAAVVSLRDRRPAPRRIAPWAAASAAAVVVLVAGGAMALLLQPDPPPDVAAPSGVTATLGEGDTFSGREIPAPDEAGPAPWSAVPLDSAAAPEALQEDWAAAENRRWCSALAPVALPQAGVDGTPRPAEFAGGWAIAWDRPEGPGQNADGTDCPDCGRSAFGVAGTGVTHAPDTGQSRTASISWSDGSFATFGPEGGDASRPKLLANLVVAGQGCQYQVWSNLGEQHLRELVDSLRFIEGLAAAPVELRTASDPQQVVEQAAPPWNASPLPAGAVDELVFEQWRALDVPGPQLYLADLGARLDGAELRSWGLGVAWNNPDGPGHDSQNQPCVDCGRGVVGIGWQPVADDVRAAVRPPKRIEWADGSYAEYGGRLADPALPRDRVLFLDPETGQETVDALQAVVHVAGADHEVIVWSHLGEEHLLELIDRLRWVDPAG